jgi:hypothetical protein
MKNDLLARMLEGQDSKTGQGMSDENIVDNVCLVSFFLLSCRCLTLMSSFLRS